MYYDDFRTTLCCLFIIRSLFCFLGSQLSGSLPRLCFLGIKGDLSICIDLGQHIHLCLGYLLILLKIVSVVVFLIDIQNDRETRESHSIVHSFQSWQVGLIRGMTRDLGLCLASARG